MKYAVDEYWLGMGNYTTWEKPVEADSLEEAAEKARAQLVKSFLGIELHVRRRVGPRLEEKTVRIDPKDLV